MNYGSLPMNTGAYATACEASTNKYLIDQWLNEGMPYRQISTELQKMGDYISDKSIAKYAKIRKERVQDELEKDPAYQNKMVIVNQTLADEVAKIKPISIMNHLAETIEHCAELVERSRIDDIKIKNIQDLRYVQTTMLESLKLYGDTIMKAQAFAEIEKDPELLRPTQNIVVKQNLINIMEGMDEDAKFRLVDAIRGGIRGIKSE